jgi:zinc protease
MKEHVKIRYTAILSTILVMLLFAGSAFAFPPVKRSVLANGLILLVVEEHSIPVVTMELLINVGSKDDPQGKEGLAQLTASALSRGAGVRSEKEISEELDFRGAEFAAQAGKDFTTVNLKVLRKDLEPVFPLFMDIVAKPTFPEAEIKKEIAQTLAAIRSLEDQPGHVAEKAFLKTLYGNGAYGHAVEGTKESVEKIDTATVEDFYHLDYGPGGSILVVVGDIDEATVRNSLMPRIEEWKGSGVKGKVAEVDYNGRGERLVIDKPVTQSNIVMGHGGVSRDNADYYAFQVMNYILGGGGLTSRLAQEIRGKRGLAYDVSSFFDAGKLGGSFQIVLQTKNASAKEAIDAAIRTIEEIRNQGVSEEELSKAKKYLLGSFPQKLSTNSRMAAFYGQVEYFGLGADYVERYRSLVEPVSAKDVLRVARTYLHPDALVTIIVADKEKAGLK